MICVYLSLICIFDILYAVSGSHIHGLNVGTVLFTETDNTRKCWSSEQLALLRSRLVFQDVLPNTHVLTMEDDQFVSILLNYFRMTLQKTKSLTAGKTKQINLMALADTLGGYLHHLVLPLGRHAFYLGKISLNSIVQLEDLYTELKVYLRTDGRNWKTPVKASSRIKRAQQIEPATAAHKHDKEKDCCFPLVYTYHSNGSFNIQTPFLDSKSDPTSIAIPYKKNPLRNIRCKSSAYVLEKFYRTAIDCMNEQNAKVECKDYFNRDFFKFIDVDVIPHLDDPELYPAFGNILRVRETITNNGQEPCSSVTTKHKGGTTTEENEYYGEEDRSTTVMFIAVGIVILIWILTGIIYCCCRMRRRKHDKDIADAWSVPKVALPGTMSSTSGPRGSGRHHSSSGPHVSILPPIPGAGGRHSSSGGQHTTAGGVKGGPTVKAGPQTSAGPVFATTGKPGKGTGSVKSTSAVDKPCSDKHCTHTLAPDTPAVKSSGKKGKAQAQATACAKCKRTKCSHVVVAPVLVSSSTIKGVKSAPASLKKENTSLPEKAAENSTNSNAGTVTAEKPIVFGYDFETSSSDSSSLEDSSSSSGQNTPKMK